MKREYVEQTNVAIHVYLHQTSHFDIPTNIPFNSLR